MATSLQAKGPKGTPVDLKATTEGGLLVELAGQSGHVPVTPDAQGSGTREHSTAGITRPAVGAASTSAALPALGASREIYVMANTNCFFLTGASAAVTAAAGTAHPLASGERFYLRVPAGHTHLAVIRESTDGFITVCAVA